MEKLETNKLVFLRGVHPSEVTAFYLADKVSELFRQKDYVVTLLTVPYECSLNYMVDHLPAVVSRFYKHEGLPKKELDKEIKKYDPSGKMKKEWESNLSGEFLGFIRDAVRNRIGTKPIVDFHSSQAPPFSPTKEDPNYAWDIFTIGNGYNGFICSDGFTENCFVVEIPAKYRELPSEILERRRDALGVIRRRDNSHFDNTRYLDRVADFKASKEEGLVSDSAAEEIANAIESVVKERVQVEAFYLT